MKCYSIKGQTLVPHLRLTTSETNPPHLFLGEEGRGRHYERVHLHKTNPPKLDSTKLLEAHPVEIKLQAKDDKPEKSFYVLAKSKNTNDPRVLVHINTECVYTKGAGGSYQILKGNPKVLVKAHGAWGAAGRVGTWDDDLIMTSPGDVIKVTPSGGYKVSPMALCHLETGELVYEKWQDYESATAIEEGEETPL